MTPIPLSVLLKTQTALQIAETEVVGYVPAITEANAALSHYIDQIAAEVAVEVEA